MKLPDYSRCVEINQLLIAMGVTKIPTLPIVKFEKEVIKKNVKEYPDLKDIEIGEKLIDSVIEVSKSEITGRAGDLLEYKGRKVCAYIRDQRFSVNIDLHTSGYKYHLCNCSTLQSMKVHGREHRYLATQRKDGSFEVNDTRYRQPRRGIVKLEFCYNCMTVLMQKNIFFTPFTLSQYFHRYDSYTPKTIRKIEEVKEIQTYPPNWDDISRKYREASQFKCQICYVDCTNFTGLVQVHHIDGNQNNNEHDNLRVLCTDCHSKQPYNEQILRLPDKKRQIEKIIKLRKEQNILMASV